MGFALLFLVLCAVQSAHAEMCSTMQGNGSSYIEHNESNQRNGALVEAQADK